MNRPTLADLYARIPDVDCKGMCWQACGPVPAAPAERRAIKAATGIDMPTAPVAEVQVAYMTGRAPRSCPALSGLGRCNAHAVRPALCRIYAVADGLPCPHGCRSETPLSDEDARAILKAAWAATE